MTQSPPPRSSPKPAYGAQAVSSPAGKTAPRLPPLDPGALTDDQRRVYDAIMAGPRGAIHGPFQAWLASPGLADRAQKLGQYARFDSVLPPALSELAILATAKAFRSEFEWWAHEQLAREAGISQSVIDAILEGREPPFEDETARIVFETATELQAQKRLSDATFARATAALGEQGLVDLVGICGYYCLVSLTLNVYEVERPDGRRLFDD